eukprot:350494-Chlamydomonas_euryale.AAC.1
MLCAPPQGLFTPPRRGGRTSASGGGPDTSLIVDDFPGDAEHAWGRLGAASATLSGVLDSFVDVARAAPWVQQLLANVGAVNGAGSGAMPAAPALPGHSAAAARQQELLLEAVGLRLLMESLQARKVEGDRTARGSTGGAAARDKIRLTIHSTVELTNCFQQQACCRELGCKANVAEPSWQDGQWNWAGSWVWVYDARMLTGAEGSQT